jgi:thiol-disulfide isomerase/thioredoxin
VARTSFAEGAPRRFVAPGACYASREMITTHRLAVGLAVLGGLLAVTPPIDAQAQSAAPAPTGRPWLGLAMDSDAQGVRVGHVIRGSPADVAGIHEGDHLVRVAGSLVGKPADVIHAVALLAVGDHVTIELTRGQATQTAQAVLATFPSQDQMVRMDLVGAPAPAWKDTQGVSGVFPASLAALRGHVVLLDFWATWCAPCRVSIPALEALQSRYGAQGLSVVGISTEDPADVTLFAQRMSMHYGVGADPRGATTRAYGVFSLPTLVVIDKAGKVRDVSVGYDPTASTTLDATVKALLAEPAPSH